MACEEKGGGLLTFRIVLQEEVEVAELAEQLGLHFALGLQDERIVAANGLREGREGGREDRNKLEDRRKQKPREKELLKVTAGLTSARVQCGAPQQMNI